MTDLCGGCGEDVHVGDEEFFYERHPSLMESTAWHAICKPREGIDMEDEKERGIVTMVKRGETNNRAWAFFYLNGKHDRDSDPSYSLDMRQAGAPVPTEGDSIFFTYKINGSYNNVVMWEKVEPVEGEVAEVAATVSATQAQRDESFYRTAALKQAVIFNGPVCISAGASLNEAMGDVGVAYLHFLTLLTNPASLREPGEAPSGGTPKPVADNNPPRDEEGYIIRASEADRASQDAQGAPPVTDPADPKYVRTGA